MEVDLLAIFKGLQFYTLLGVPKIIVETNCLLAMQALEKGVESVADHRNLLLEILRFKNKFIECTFNYVSQQGNQVAHSLARYVWQVATTMVLWDSCPDFLLSSLRIDSNYNSVTHG